MTEPVLQAAHLISMNNREVLVSGGACGCFHCQKSFDASQVIHWGGKENTTALCPFCHYDTVLSSKVAPIDATFLRQMFNLFFAGDTRQLSGFPNV